MAKEQELKEAIKLLQKILHEKKSLLTGDMNAAIALLEKHKLKEAISICYQISDAEAKVSEYADELITPLFFKFKEIVIKELKE